jgi:hypothetical protein
VSCRGVFGVLVNPSFVLVPLLLLLRGLSSLEEEFEPVPWVSPSDMLGDTTKRGKAKSGASQLVRAPP